MPMVSGGGGGGGSLADVADENTRLRFEKQQLNGSSNGGGMTTRFGGRRALGDIGNLVGALTSRNGGGHAAGNSHAAKEDAAKVCMHHVNLRRGGKRRSVSKKG